MTILRKRLTNNASGANCGIGEGGFQNGNTCAKGGGGSGPSGKVTSDGGKGPQVGALAAGKIRLAEKHLKQAKRDKNKVLVALYEKQIAKYKSGDHGVKSTANAVPGPALNELRAKLNVARLRRESLDGREYLVVPTTIMRPNTVMNGSKGPLFYPREEVAKNVGSWNGMPLLLNHPPEGNTGRTPEMIRRYGLGTVFNDRVTKNGSRVAEAWFDVEKVRRHDAALPADKRMLPRLEKGMPIDVSTGLFTDDKPVKNGVKLKDHRGRDYVGDVATNYRPDHLAVLPTTRGACSVTDGCGTHVENSNPEGCNQHTGPGCGTSHANATRINHHADRVAREDVSDSLDEEYAEVVSRLKKEKITAPKDVIVAALKSASSTHTGGKGMNLNQTTNDEGDDMTAKQRKAKVAHLVANCGCWQGKEGVLNEMDDETLVAVASQAEQLASNVEAVGALREVIGIDDDSLVFNAEYVKGNEFKTKMAAACTPEPEAETPKGKKKMKPAFNADEDLDQDALQKAIEEQVAKAVANHPTVRNAERTVAKERADLRARLTVVANLRTTPAAKKTLILNKLKDAALPNESLEELLTLVGDAPATRNALADDDLPDYSGAGSGYEGVTDNAEDDEELGKFADDDGMSPTINWSGDRAPAYGTNGKAKK